ncbi:MAG TPA: undecaprenyl-diphosphate phosphatase [Phycisphaerae bacterium]|nr:undecaprenyl-diphosphate phosphatase [Phycisphaerae bacterium]
MLTVWQAIFLGFLQGFSELFPISSLGHLIIIKGLLHWNFSFSDQHFLPFVVALHLATAIALIIYFWKQWLQVFMAYIGSVQRMKLVYDDDSKLAWLLVAGTLVIVPIGFLFEKKIRLFFEDPRYYWMVAGFLIINGLLMLLGDYVKNLAVKRAAQQQEKRAEDLSFINGILVGASQSLAFLPGISRSGATIVAGVIAGLSYEQACRFGFMLATPAILAASVLELPKLFRPEARTMLHLTMIGALTAGVTAYLSTIFLMKYFQTRKLTPFAVYCVLAGIIAMVLLRP